MNQTSVSHSSIVSEVISSDTGLRMDGIRALDIWDLIILVLHLSFNQTVYGNLCDNEQSGKRSNASTKKHPNRDLRLTNVDHVTSNAKLSHSGALLYIFESDEAVIKMIIKGRNPTMRHVFRPHRVALDWSFDRIKWDPTIQIQYVDTKN